MQNKIITTLFSFLLSVGTGFCADSAGSNDISVFEKYVSKAVTTDETARCLNCHASRQIKLVESWEKTKHAANQVGCFECHAAEPNDPAAVPGHFGFCVKLPVTPKTCGSCHTEQYASFASSSHALAFDRIKNNPIRQASPIVFETTCASCHGNETTLKRGKAVDESWPNHGIGRINTDGSRGNCAACHGFHEDSLERVRSSDTCVACHSNSFSPAVQAWKNSKHGASWQAYAKSADMNVKGFVSLNEPVMRPDCFVCHFAAAKEGHKSTHNPSERLSWKLAALKATHTDNWGDKRLMMQETCRNCHASTQTEQFYRRLDALVVETNKIVEKLADNSTENAYKNNKIKSLATKSRVGAAMMSPAHRVEAIEELLELK